MSYQAAAEVENRWRVPALCWLFAANAIASTYVAAFANSEEAEAPIGIALGIVLAQTTLLAVWTALGAAPAMARLAGSLLLLSLSMVAVMILARRDIGSASEGALIAFMMLGLWLLFQAPLWLLRIAFGLRIDEKSKSITAPAASEKQFSIGQILAVTAMAGALLGAGRLANAWGVFQELFIDREVIVIIGVFISAAIALAASATFSALARKHVVLWLAQSIVFFAAVVWLALTVIGYATPGAAKEDVFLVWHFAAQYAWLLACLLLVRFAGYRLVRRRAGA
jgi:hypothetical protein